MATHCHGISTSSNELISENQSVADFLDREVSQDLGFGSAFPDQELVMDAHSYEGERANLLQKHSLVNENDDNPNKCGLSNGILRYIDHILVGGGDMANKIHTSQGSLDLQAKGRSPYVLLENQSTAEFFDPPVGNELEPEEMVCRNTFQEQNVGGMYLLQDQAFPNKNGDSHCNCDSRDQIIRYIDHILMEDDQEDVAHMLQESSDFKAKVNSFYGLLNQKCPSSPPQESGVPQGQCGSSGASCPNSEYEKNSCAGARGNKKNRQVEENDSEENKTTKLARAGTEANSYPPEEFDDFWVYTDGGRERKLVDYIRNLRISASKRMQHTGVRGRPLSKKQNMKKEVVDLESLLVKCAQSISSGEYRAANELLWKIREHSSPNGDGTQRLAHYFANGLEARQACIGSQIYKSLVQEKKSPYEYLKLYFLSFVSSSFIKISTLISSKQIMLRSEKARRIHIIDFGISYGFQWPAFIRQLAEREGGPPELRITGVDFPQPGPWPRELAGETGRRLAMYSKMFRVPFKYDVITQAWESVRIEDLKIETGEFVVVNCLYNSKKLLGNETMEECSKSMFLDLVRRINPEIFVHGVINGDYSEPFFLPRFRKVLFHYSALFDMVDTIVPRDNQQRVLVEKVFGMEMMNVIACKGPDRVERPETYKQWQMRHLDAGLRQVAFGGDLVDMVMQRVRKFYHRDFVIDDENRWLLMSWKGRILCAMSCWQADCSTSLRECYLLGDSAAVPFSSSCSFEKGRRRH